jgi:choline dehydrogenase-like flavoprotein
MDTRTSPEEITRYDFIICGSGASAPVLARCLAETADVRVLLLEGAESETPWVPASLTTNALDSREGNHAEAPSPSRSCVAAVQPVPGRITMRAHGEGKSSQQLEHYG